MVKRVHDDLHEEYQKDVVAHEVAIKESEKNHENEMAIV